MQSESVSRWSSSAVSSVGIIFVGVMLFFVLDLPIQDSEAIAATPTNTQTPHKLIDHTSVELTGIPMRLKIPKINVDAAIESVGLTSQGAVGVPKTPSNAAWFKSWPRPGEVGSSIIVGHYGRWKNGKGSVFDGLSKLRKGDRLSVEDEKKMTTVFVVREIRSYDLNANAVDVFYSNDRGSHLNLITCEGVWNPSTKRYAKRLVVFTDKE